MTLVKGSFTDPLSTLLDVLNNYPSITSIMGKSFKSLLSFREASFKRAKHVIKYQHIKKACQCNKILTKVIKLNMKIFTRILE